MEIAHANGIELCYQHSGSGEPIVLIQGVARQLIEWPRELLCALNQNGYQTLVFDHRDSGLSTHYDRVQQSTATEVLKLIKKGHVAHLPYQLSDLASDTRKLCDALEVQEFHCVAYSMGGMVAQLLALSSPERLKSLTLINTHSGHRPTSIPPDPKAELSLFSAPIKKESSLLNYLIRLRSRLAGNHSTLNKGQWSSLCAPLLARGYSAQGQLNQMYAISAAQDRSRALVDMQIPTLLIQGEQDPLIPLSAAEQLKKLLPHANLHLIPSMGHELEHAYVDLLTQLILAHLEQSG